MLEQPGEVVAVTGQAVRVDCAGRRDCALCAAGRGCGGALLGRLVGQRRHAVEARSTGPGLQPGDRVMLELPETAILRAAAIAYLLPLAGLVTGAVSGDALGGDPAAIAGAATGLALAACGARLVAGLHAAQLQPRARRL